MSKVYAFMADGFETVECLAIVDLMRRAKIETVMVSISNQYEVTSKQHVTVKTDKLLKEVNLEDADVMFLPGGIPGTQNLEANKDLEKALRAQFEKGKRIAAICAAPSIIGKMGLLRGKKATCYPGYEKDLLGAIYVPEKVVTDGTITTGRGMGVSVDLGLELVKLLVDEKTAKDMAATIQFI